MEVRAFLVDDLLENPEEADGIPVRLIEKGMDVDGAVYLGTRGVNHPKLTAELVAVGFTQIIPVTVELDIKLRNSICESFIKKRERNFF